MTAFLIASVPAAFALIVAVLRDSESTSRAALRPALRGVAMFAPAYIVLFLLRYAIVLEFEPGRLYFYYTFRDYLFLTIVAVFGFVLAVRSQVSEPKRTTTYRSLGFYFGFFLLAGVVDAVMYGRSHTAYTLFLLPVTRVVTALYAAVLSSLSRLFSGFVRYLLLLTIAGFAALAGTVPLLFALNYLLPACAIMVFMAALSVTLFVFGCAT